MVELPDIKQGWLIHKGGIESRNTGHQSEFAEEPDMEAEAPDIQIQLPDIKTEK